MITGKLAEDLCSWASTNQVILICATEYTLSFVSSMSVVKGGFCSWPLHYIVLAPGGCKICSEQLAVFCVASWPWLQRLQIWDYPMTGRMRRNRSTRHSTPGGQSSPCSQHISTLGCCIEINLYIDLPFQVNVPTVLAPALQHGSVSDEWLI